MLSVGFHVAHGTWNVCLAGLPVENDDPPLEQVGSVAGSLVGLAPPGPVLPCHQLHEPSSSHQKSTPLGSRVPSGRTPTLLSS